MKRNFLTAVVIFIFAIALSACNGGLETPATSAAPAQTNDAVSDTAQTEPAAAEITAVKTDQTPPKDPADYEKMRINYFESSGFQYPENGITDGSVKDLLYEFAESGKAYKGYDAISVVIHKSSAYDEADIEKLAGCNLHVLEEPDTNGDLHPFAYIIHYQARIDTDINVLSGVIVKLIHDSEVSHIDIAHIMYGTEDPFGQLVID